MTTLSLSYPVRRLRRRVRRLFRRLLDFIRPSHAMRIDQFTDELDSILKGNVRR